MATHTPRPTPKFFAETEAFSTKKSRATPKDKAPPRPPLKSAPPISRIFTKQAIQKAQAISFKSPETSLYSDIYTNDTKELYFRKCFDVECKLGAGSFGEVFKVRSKEDGQYYAVKRSRERFRGPSDRQRKLEEVKKHEELPEHINCIKFYKAWEERAHLYIQSELCSTSLSNYTEQNHDIPESQIWKYFVDLLMAVKHLHDHNLLHLDIKPDNIFISSNDICKLGDFGLILDLKKRDFAEAQEGDPKYLAPELLEGKFTKAADIFSLGITMLELACDLDLPRGGEAWQQLRHNSLPTEICSQLSSPLKNLIQEMMKFDYKQRPTVCEIIAMPVVRKVARRRKFELKIKNALNKIQTTLHKFWLYLIAAFHRIFTPVSWLFTPVNMRKENRVMTSTPSMNSFNTTKGNQSIWDPSFSDDDFDELNYSNESSIDPIPLPESSFGDTKTESFFIPSLPRRITNSTPAMVKNRTSANKNPFLGIEGYKFGQSPNISLSPCAQSAENLAFHSQKTNDANVLRNSIGPRNLMQVFDAADSDSDDET